MLQWGTPEDLNSYLKWSNYFNKKKKQKILNIKNNINLMPMAGFGKRFIKDGYKIPKPFIKVKKNPMFINAMLALPKSYKNIFLFRKDLSKYKIKHKINNFFKKNKIYFLNKNTQGQASTCALGLKNEDDKKSIIIGTCDCSIDYDNIKLKKLINNNNIHSIVFTFRKNQTVKAKPNDYTYLKVNKNDFVNEVHEKKPFSTNPYNDHAIVGVFFFRNKKIFFDGFNEILKKSYKINNEFYVDSIIKMLVKKKYKVKTFEVTNYIGWGTPNDLKTYEYWQDFFVNKKTKPKF